MAFKLIWSDGALADVDRICAYIAGHNAQAAYEVARGIFDHVNILSSFPLIGPTYPRGSRGPLREIVF
jgi:plasmid stabilization system protein ParE